MSSGMTREWLEKRIIELQRENAVMLALLDEAASVIGASSTDDYHTAEEEKQDEEWMRRYNELKRSEEQA